MKITLEVDTKDPESVLHAYEMFLPLALKYSGNSPITIISKNEEINEKDITI